MSDSRDDDALGWAGDDDPTLSPVGVPERDAAPAAAPGPSPASAPTPARRTVLDEAEDAEDRAAEKELAEAEAASKQLSSAALIGLGVLGGIYLLYTIGWIVSFGRYVTPAEMSFGVFSDLIARTLAIAAPPFWFVATLLITQRRDVRYRFLWLVIGVLVLVPWPFLLGGGA
ncbi:hypothetical protein [Herbiconiux daphne]|uniref:DNA polymerase III subunit gamma/tau n=1 Tax=Herbiconiux daphne TaxID=2970914 RepID=A0ABT2H4W4_9MICO|nr:hypothetical protein [Herbiconiux daphne]MCS5734966.1 hypothetical protein [Herbiconiux daphne]